jgi:hypothetical protein
VSPRDDLEHIKLDVDAELAMAESSRPPPTVDAPLFDPTGVEAYEVRLRSLHDSVLAVEEIVKDIGDA